MLRILTLATATLGVDVDRYAAGAGPDDRSTVNDLAAVTEQLWHDFLDATVKTATAASIHLHVERLTNALSRPQTETIRRKLSALTADTFQLAGEVAFDGGRYAEAAQCYTLALTAAREAKAADLAACALTRNAYLCMFDQQPAQALPLLEVAAKHAGHGDNLLPTRQWVAAVTAQAHAATGDQAMCERALELAGTVPAPRPRRHGWLRFDSSRLPEDRAACYLALGQAAAAENQLKKILHTTTAGRRRGIALADLAAAGALRRDPLRVVTYGTAALEHAHQSHSAVVARRLQHLRSRLSRFRADPHVRHLDDQIAGLADPLT